MKNKNKSGFTLLEIIIVIIIVGVLASLALPRFFATVEFSRSTEALASLAALRQSIERCYLQKGGNYTGCTIATLDLEDPGNSPNNHFTYAITAATPTDFTIMAQRNTRDGGDATAGTNTIYVKQSGNVVSKGGTGKFQGLQ